VRLAVVGAGIMGAHHARIVSSMRDASLEFVVDDDVERARVLAESVGTRHTQCLDDVLDDIDAAVVAVPNELHHEIALVLIKAGRHVLVEKPIATDVDEAEDMLAAADDAGVTLMVGHVERFNPAVLELDNLVRDVVHVAASRISPFSPRVQDSVVLDLMIHDLDLVCSLARSPVAEVHVVGRTVRSTTPDIASALVRFETGLVANLTASRIGQQKIRELRITQPDSFVTVDLIRQDVTINRLEHSEFLSSEGARYRQSGVVEIPFLEHRGEPISLELQEFVRAASTGTAPRVTGRDGVNALRLALQVEQAIQLF
jgi:predicted dehydrogenase